MCVGVAVGAIVSKLRLDVTALAGLLSAPIAFNIARTVHRGVSTALQLSVSGTGGPSPLVLGAIKALEFGALGALLSWIARRGKAGGWAYAGAGLAIGGVFGSAALAYVYSSSATRLTAAVLVPRAINEVLFPLGCSLVLLASDVVGKHLKSAP